jgi:hypothetical protein
MRRPPSAVLAAFAKYCLLIIVQENIDMFRAIIESVLGEWGRAILYFYDEYSLWINLVVVIYGMWVVLSWVNLKNIRKPLISSIADQLRSRPEISSKTLSKKQLNSLVIPWESAVRQSRFPYVARQNAIVPRRVTVTQIQALLPIADLVAEAWELMNRQEKQQA